MGEEADDRRKLDIWIEKFFRRQQARFKKKPDTASDRLFVSDDETYEFFGFNTTYLDKG